MPTEPAADFLHKDDMLIRAILPDWAKEEYPDRPKVVEAEMDQGKILQLNEQLYNIYYTPNYPSIPPQGIPVEGKHIDTFHWVFADMDLKDGKYPNKDAFIEAVWTENLLPTKIVDSGNGVHAYWRVSDLDAMSFLRLQRRLIRHFNTDEAVAKIYQLMRLPGTVNTKHKEAPKLCEEIHCIDNVYTCEQLHALLPPITLEDEQYCQSHYDKIYHPEKVAQVKDRIPPKFGQLLHTNAEVKRLWSTEQDDRSKSDYRLAHLMFANGLTKDEAMSVLVNCPKALTRSPANQIGYAQNIVDKIWTYELAENKKDTALSRSVKDILAKSGDQDIKGIRFPCSDILDATEHGFRLGQVMGLVAGSGVGKTAVALNMFMWFVERNPEYTHFFIPLEQPSSEIADRWKALCGDNEALHDRVHVLSNYDDDGKFRHLTFAEIKEYILRFKAENNCQVGCVVVDHIGALKKGGSKAGENQDLMAICHEMKGFAVETNTFLVMQSQTSREKAGIGDLELDKDAAFGTVFFESYCDYLITIWQPLKRLYSESDCPKLTAFKFCKIRNKRVGIDYVQEDVPYILRFDPSSGRLSELTQDLLEPITFWVNKATNKRKLDRKTDVVAYKSTNWSKDERSSATNNSNDHRTDGATAKVS